jgi:hypothetical protein
MLSKTFIISYFSGSVNSIIWIRILIFDKKQNRSSGDAFYNSNDNLFDHKCSADETN